jgi:Zn finger protein HypA/HybF involved in hydrogenase expression
MPTKCIDPDAIGHDEDWEGNNAAFTCPGCKKFYIVSGHMHKEGRACPHCRQSRGLVVGGKGSGGTAIITWP